VQTAVRAASSASAVASYCRLTVSSTAIVTLAFGSVSTVFQACAHSQNARPKLAPLQALESAVDSDPPLPAGGVLQLHHRRKRTSR